MPALLRAVAPTPCITLQDRGRRGWRRFGVTGAGAMDRTGHALANALVGNRAGEVTLEFAYAAGEWLVEAPSFADSVGSAVFRTYVSSPTTRKLSESAASAHHLDLRLDSPMIGSFLRVGRVTPGRALSWRTPGPGFFRCYP